MQYRGHGSTAQGHAAAHANTHAESRQRGEEGQETYEGVAKEWLPLSPRAAAATRARVQAAPWKARNRAVCSALHVRAASPCAANRTSLRWFWWSQFAVESGEGTACIPAGPEMPRDGGRNTALLDGAAHAHTQLGTQLVVVDDSARGSRWWYEYRAWKQGDVNGSGPPHVAPAQDRAAQTKLQEHVFYVTGG